MEFVSLGDSVKFGINTHTPVSGTRVNADETPRWYVFEDKAHDHMLSDLFIRRSGNANDFVGAYVGQFDSSGVLGFESNKYYEVLASGKVSGITAFDIVKGFVIDDSFNAVVTNHYADGAIWIDTNNGTAGTTDYINGTAENPVNTLADALTLASSLGLKKLRIHSNSSITLTSSIENYELIGEFGWTLDLGSQSINGTSIVGARISGTCTGSFWLRNCLILSSGISHSSGGFTIQNTGIAGTITTSGVGILTLYNTYESPTTTIGSATAIIALTSGSRQTLDVHNHIGRLSLTSMAVSTSNVRINSGVGAITLAASVTAGSVTIYGQWDITDNSSATVTNFRQETDVWEVIGSDVVGNTVEEFHAPPSGIADAVWDELRSGHVGAGSFGEYVNANVTYVSGVPADPELDLYYADIHYVKDSNNTRDEYAVFWFKNSSLLSSGNISNPAITVFNTADGSKYISNQTLDFIGEDGILRHNSTLLIPSGEPLLIMTSGTIDSQTRSFSKIAGLSLI